MTILTFHSLWSILGVWGCQIEALQQWQMLGFLLFVLFVNCSVSLCCYNTKVNSLFRPWPVNVLSACYVSLFQCLSILIGVQCSSAKISITDHSFINNLAVVLMTNEYYCSLVSHNELTLSTFEQKFVSHWIHVQTCSYFHCYLYPFCIYFCF